MCEWLLLTRVNFEAMKSLSGWEAAHSDKHQFHAKIKVSILAVFELSLLDKWSEQRKKKEEKRQKMALLLSHTFAFSCLPRGFWTLI